MRDIPFVKPEELEVARAMEEAILRLPDTVVTFAGVAVYPSFEEGPTYWVFVGCPRNMETAACGLAVSLEIRKQWKTEVVEVSVRRGIVRAEKVDVSQID